MKMNEADVMVKKAKLIKETVRTAVELRGTFQNDTIIQLTGEIIDYLKPLANHSFRIDTAGTTLENTFSKAAVNIGSSITYEKFDLSSNKTQKHIARSDQICKLLLNYGPTVVNGVRKSIQGDMELLVSLLNRSIGLKHSNTIRIELPRMKFYTYLDLPRDKPDAVTRYIKVDMRQCHIHLYYSYINRTKKEYKCYTLYNGYTGSISWDIFVQMSTGIANTLEKWLKSSNSMLNNTAKNEQWVVDSLTKLRNTKRMEARLLA
jgi:hypothetical protein